MRALVYSVRDPAGKGIAEYLREVTSSEKTDVKNAVEAWYIRELDSILAGFEEDIIFLDFLDDIFDNVEFYIVLSRHSAASGMKSLTTHHTGNPLKKALAGGKPMKLAVANPPVTWLLLTYMKEEADMAGLKDFQVTFEVTHHGPTEVNKPLSFIEIGSTPDEWGMKKAHRVIGDVVIKALKSYSGSAVNCVPTVGFGGPHYAEKFGMRAFEKNECYGHIISRYALKELRDEPELLTKIVMDTLSRTSIPPKKMVMLKKVGSIPKKIIAEIASKAGVELEIV